MTLLETERLVRKIAEMLQQVGNPDLAPKLAGDYGAACHAANLRLQQCEAMIKAGDRPQAIQLAETAPNLLDLVTVLEFRGSDEWRGYCQQNSLPVADRIDARSVRSLNECYAQGITTDHPLYASYRAAVLGRNDGEALKTLQSITRLNPSDANAASELVRLDAKVLGARLQHLGGSLDGAEPTIIATEVESIEAFGFKNKPDGEVWRKAQTIRCGVLLDEANKLKTAMRWQDTLAKVDLIHGLEKEFKVELAASSLKHLNELEAWSRTEQEKDRKDREFRCLLAELHHKIHQSEEKDTSARYVKLPEMRDDYEALHKVWRSLTDFTRPIPEDAAASFRKRSSLLEAEVARRTAIQRRAILAGSLVALALGGIAVWFVLGQMKARSFAAELKQAVEQRQARTAEKLLEQVRGNGRLLNVSSVNAAAAGAETFVVKQQTLLTNFETAFSKLPKEFAGQPDLLRLSLTADQLAAARAALDALAPDLKTENEPRLEAIEKQWQNFLGESSVAANGLLDQWISSAEEQCLKLDYRAPLEQTTAQLASLSVLAQKIDDAESGFTNHLSLRNELLQRANTVRAKVNAYQEELKKLNDGEAVIRKAHTIKDFASGINLIASSEFSVSPAATAAIAVQSLDANDESTLRNLLGVTNGNTWSYVSKIQAVKCVPEIAMPAERQIFEQLNADPAVAGSHPRARLVLDRNGNDIVEWITSGEFDTSTGWKQIKAWTPSATATRADFEDREYGYFGEQMKLSATQPVYHVQLLDDRKETAAFGSVGLANVWSGGDSYGKPLLEVLDSIKDSREGSALLRAYLFLALTDLMKLQPDAWGLTFCPAASSHEAQIRGIVGGRLNSGDWFVPMKVSAYSNRLEQFFASVGNISYMKQAAGLMTLAHAASRDGLQYVGFVGLDGRPNYVDDSANGEVWGYVEGRKQPILLAENVSSGKLLKKPAMRLSPLFALAAPIKEYLAKADVNPIDPCFGDALPTLFQPQRRL